MTNKTTTERVAEASGYAIAGTAIGLSLLAVAAGLVAVATYVPPWLFALAAGSGAVIGLGTYIAHHRTHPPADLRVVQNHELIPDTPDLADNPWPAYDPFTTGDNEQ